MKKYRKRRDSCQGDEGWWRARPNSFFNKMEEIWLHRYWFFKVRTTEVKEIAFEIGEDRWEVIASDERWGTLSSMERKITISFSPSSFLPFNLFKYLMLSVTFLASICKLFLWQISWGFPVVQKCYCSKIYSPELCFYTDSP